MADEGKLPPFNLLLYSAFSLVLYAIIIPGTPKSIQYASVPIVVLISHQLIANTTTGSVILDAGVGCMLLIQPMMHFANVLLIDPNSLVDYSHAHSKSNKFTEHSWWNRVLWTLKLSLNIRGIGWKHEVRHIPGSRYPASTSRWTFAHRTTRRIMYNALIMGAGHAAIVYNPKLISNGSLSAAPIHWQILATLSCGFAVRSGIDNIYLTAALCSVVGGFSTPEWWPDLFGSVLDAWSVSRFWSVTWHQMLRRSLTIYATSLTRLLGIYRSPSGTRRSLAETVIWLWAVFSLSGLVHIGGEYMAARRLLLDGGIFKFFMFQPVAIILERILFFRIMSATSIRSGPHFPPISLRIVGYCWVVFWFTWGFVPVVDVYLSTGAFTTNPLQDLTKIRLEDIWREFAHELDRTAALIIP